MSVWADGALAFVRGLRSSPPVELELRLGRSGVHGFDPSITKEEMDRLLQLVSGAADHDTCEWAESHDIFFTHGGRHVRTSVAFDDGDFTIQPTHMVKERLGSVDAARYRVAWATETPVPPDKLPFSTEVDHMRIKQRRSIEVRPKEISSALWRYDFTMVWSGGNKQAAEIQQQTSDPRYELEVEVLPCGAQELVAFARDGGRGPAAAEAKAVEYLVDRLQEIGQGLSALLV
jgi:hypothetical protein